MNQTVRHAVEVAVDNDVIVDVDPRGGPIAVLIAFGRQRENARKIVER